MLRALRGAITVSEDASESILSATRELLNELTEANNLQPSWIISAFFTATPDLRSEFPAAAARQLGWHSVPMLDAVEIDKPGAMPRCVRVLLHVDFPPGAADPVHIYLREAAGLRPDLAGKRHDS